MTRRGPVYRPQGTISSRVQTRIGRGHRGTLNSDAFLLALLGVAWTRDKLRPVQLIGGGAAFLLLAVWTGGFLTDDLLNWLLGFTLLFAVFLPSSAIAQEALVKQNVESRFSVKVDGVTRTPYGLYEVRLGDEWRINLDEGLIRALREHDFGVALSFGNYR